MRVAVISVDPTRRRTGGALLGDRIRMNSLRSKRVYMRSMATRRQHVATNAVLKDCIAFLRGLGYDLVMVETAGIGQSDSEIVDLVDFPVYVMTSEYGAASQLEKIDMLDFAELVVLNKFDKRGAEDALRDVRKQWKRNRVAFKMKDEDVPVYPTIASQFNDPGVTWMFANLCRLVRDKLKLGERGREPALQLAPEPRHHAARAARDDPDSGRAGALSGRDRRAGPRRQRALRVAGRDREPRAELPRHAARSRGRELPKALDRYERRGRRRPARCRPLAAHAAPALQRGDRRADRASRSQLLREWPARRKAITSEKYSYEVRGKELTGDNYRESLSHQKIPKIAPPTYRDWGDLLKFLGKENLPGAYPYTAGVFPYRRVGEDPTRMFAGEGTPERTNRRFHYLSHGQGARLSTAFDSVTLYGEDPHTRPDIFGKIGNSGVNIATLDDMKKLYSGFDLCAPTTSVSMTINGPGADHPRDVHEHRDRPAGGEAPARGRRALGRGAPEVGAPVPGTPAAAVRGHAARGNDGLGLGLLGRDGRRGGGTRGYERIKKHTLQTVRGTVQADILKEDQAQNTCIFSTEFAMRMMGDIQQHFVDHKVRNFYSGLDSRLPHRGGRREPDLAARVHALERLHHRRVLPRARHEGRRLRPEPVVLLLQRHGPGIHR
jgi:methylmalonyl-CoA mutase